MQRDGDGGSKFNPSPVFLPSRSKSSLNTFFSFALARYSTVPSGNLSLSLPLSPYVSLGLGKAGKEEKEERIETDGLRDRRRRLLVSLLLVLLFATKRRHFPEFLHIPPPPTPPALSRESDTFSLPTRRRRRRRQSDGEEKRNLHPLEFRSRSRFAKTKKKSGMKKSGTKKKKKNEKKKRGKGKYTWRSELVASRAKKKRKGGERGEKREQQCTFSFPNTDSYSIAPLLPRRREEAEEGEIYRADKKMVPEWIAGVKKKEKKRERKGLVGGRLAA